MITRANACQPSTIRISDFYLRYLAFYFSLLSELKIQLQLLYLIISDIFIPSTRIYPRLRSTKTLF